MVETKGHFRQIVAPPAGASRHWHLLGNLRTLATVERKPTAQLRRSRLDSGADLLQDVGVVLEKLLGVLATLTEALLIEIEPRPALAHDSQVDPDVEDAAFDRDPLVVHDVELGLPEGRRDLVLDDLHPRPRPDGVGAVLDRLDAADIHSHRGVELQRVAAGGGLWAAEHHTDLHP